MSIPADTDKFNLIESQFIGGRMRDLGGVFTLYRLSLKKASDLVTGIGEKHQNAFIYRGKLTYRGNR